MKWLIFFVAVSRQIQRLGEGGRRYGEKRRSLKGKSNIQWAVETIKPHRRAHMSGLILLGRTNGWLFGAERLISVRSGRLRSVFKLMLPPKSRFRAASRWRLLIPPIQKSFFFFFPSQLDWRGRRREGGGVVLRRPDVNLCVPPCVTSVCVKPPL